MKAYLEGGPLLISHDGSISLEANDLFTPNEPTPAKTLFSDLKHIELFVRGLRLLYFLHCELLLLKWLVDTD